MYPEFVDSVKFAGHNGQRYHRDMADFKPVSINFVTNLEDFRAKLEMIPGNVKTRLAIGLTRIAVDAENVAENRFGDHFIERTSYMRRGIASWKATKDRPTAAVGTINTLMGLHIAGGRKPGPVALEGVRGEDKKGKAVGAVSLINVSKKIQGKSRQSKRFFTIVVNGEQYVMAKQDKPQERQRIRKGKGKTAPVYPRNDLIPMYNVRRGGKKSKIKADWKLYLIVLDRMLTVGHRIMLDVLEDAWDHALSKGRLTGPNPYRDIEL